VARIALLSRPLWFDELFTVWAARLSLRDLVQALRLDSGPPGFYVMERPFAEMAGRGAGWDWLVRLLPFAAVATLFLGAKRLSGSVSRTVFVALLSASVLLNLYSGEARPYGLLALFGLALFLLALQGEETGGRLAALWALSAVALYTHYLAIFAVLSLGLLAARAGRRRACAALAGSLAVFAPWIPVLAKQPAPAVAWMREAPATSLVGFLSALGAVGRIPTPFGPPAHRLLFLAAAVAGAALAVLVALRARADRAVREALAFVLLVLAGVLVVGLWRPIAFAGRSEIIVLPVWFWAVARSAEHGRTLRWLSASAVLLGAAATAGVLVSARPRAPLDELTGNLERVAGPRDVVLASAGFYLPARLASDQGRLQAEVRALPEELARHPGWFVPALPGAAEEELVSRVTAGVAPGGRVFLLLPPAYATPGLRAALASSAGRVRELIRTPEVVVLLATPARPNPG
jgi:hypothetical protein